jgi:LacI family transcriptional regulator
MAEDDDRRRATVHDVAREAGVSLATVDRVLNGRPGVRPVTAQKVQTAIAALDFRRDLSASLLARSRELHLRFLIPDGSNEFMEILGAAIRRRARAAKAERLRIETVPLPPLDVAALVAELDALTPKTCDCVVIVAVDDAAVIRAVDAAGRRGIAVMTLVSDLPNSGRQHFVGIDNVAAGRTAASMMGRFLGTGGRVAVLAGSLGLRDHAQRLEGFRAVMSAEFPAVEIVGPFEGHDERGETEALALDLLARHPDLVGLYNLGAGNAGLMSALAGTGRAGALRVIAHELTGPTRAGLRSGAIDVVLDQNPNGEVRAAIAAARTLAQRGAGRFDDDPIEIGIFLRDKLR